MVGGDGYFMVGAEGDDFGFGDGKLEGWRPPSGSARTRQ
jgi:hypothetical protein